MLEKTKKVVKDHASEYGVSDKVWKEIKDVENGVKILLELKSEYEANKHYIELGKAVEKAYELEGVEFIEFNNFDGGTVKFFHGTDDLLEWAEGRSND